MTAELNKFSIKDAAARFRGPWNPQDLARVGDRVLRVAEFAGTYGDGLHAHEYDEVFIVVNGQIRIKTTSGVLELGSLDGVVVPAGMPHQPSADSPAIVLMLDKEE